MRHNFQFDFTGPIKSIKNPRIGLARKGADDFANALGLQQSGKTCIAITCIVGYDHQIARAMVDQSIHQREGQTRCAKAANENGCAILDIGYRSRSRFCDLVYHLTGSFYPSLRFRQDEIPFDDFERIGHAKFSSQFRIIYGFEIGDQALFDTKNSIIL